MNWSHGKRVDPWRQLFFKLETLQESYYNPFSSSACVSELDLVKA